MTTDDITPDDLRRRSRESGAKAQEILLKLLGPGHNPEEVKNLVGHIVDASSDWALSRVLTVVDKLADDPKPED